MFETYFVPILIFAVLGLLAGVLLTAASKIFYVKTSGKLRSMRLCRLLGLCKCNR